MIPVFSLRDNNILGMIKMHINNKQDEYFGVHTVFVFVMDVMVYA